MISDFQDLHKALNEYFEAKFGENYRIGLITGSVAAGVANSRSDLDLVIVLNDYSSVVRQECDFKAFNVKGRKADALVMSLKFFKHLISLINHQRFKDDTRENMSIEKIMNSAVVFGCDIYDEVIDDRVRAEFGQRLFLAQRHISWGIFDDYVGMCVEKNSIGRVEMLQNLIRNELECMLIKTGNTFRKTKWISKKLEGLGAAGEEYLKFYREKLLIVPGLSDSNLTPWEVEIWNFQRKIQLNLLFGGFGDQASGTSLSKRTSNTIDGNETTIAYLIVKNGSRYFLQSFNGNYEVSATAASIAAAHGLVDPCVLGTLNGIGEVEFAEAKNEVSQLLHRA